MSWNNLSKSDHPRSKCSSYRTLFHVLNIVVCQVIHGNLIMGWKGWDINVQCAIIPIVWNNAYRIFIYWVLTQGRSPNGKSGCNSSPSVFSYSEGTRRQEPAKAAPDEVLGILRRGECLKVSKGVRPWTSNKMPQVHQRHSAKYFKHRVGWEDNHIWVCVQGNCGRAWEMIKIKCKDWGYTRWFLHAFSYLFC